jgi:hypothetical protein
VFEDIVLVTGVGKGVLLGAAVAEVVEFEIKFVVGGFEVTVELFVEVLGEEERFAVEVSGADPPRGDVDGADVEVELVVVVAKAVVVVVVPEEVVVVVVVPKGVVVVVVVPKGVIVVVELLVEEVGEIGELDVVVELLRVVEVEILLDVLVVVLELVVLEAPLKVIKLLESIVKYPELLLDPW